jgi:hypothetical protein
MGQLGAKFIVTGGHATYLGTWRIEFISSTTTKAKVKSAVVDQLAQAQLELTQIYTGPPKSISVILLEATGDGSLTLFSRPPVD